MGIGKDFAKVPDFSLGIADAELLENPTLEGCGAFFPFLLQTFPLFFPGPDGSLELFDSFLLAFLEPFQFRFLELALLDQRFLLSFRQQTVFPTLVPLLLGLLHECLVLLDSVLGFCFERFQLRLKTFR